MAEPTEPKPGDAVQQEKKNIILELDSKKTKLLQDLLTNLINDGYFLDKTAKISGVEKIYQQGGQELPIDQQMKREEINAKWQLTSEILNMIRDK